jgi:predicted kinase
MLIGVPGAGKSTWIANQMFDWNRTVVASTDNYIEKQAAQQGTTYSDVFKGAIGAANSAMKRTVAQAVEDQLDIVWDQTNITAASRKSKLAMIPDSYEKIAVVFSTPDSREHERRLASRPGKTIPQHAIDQMIRDYAAPTRSEGFDQIIQAS